MKLNFDINGKTKKIDRYWELVVGSCHAATALREDYRQQLLKCRQDLGFKYVRFHGLFDDDMSVLRKSMLNGNYVLSFTNIDSIYDFLLSIGMKPFIELSFMPECLKSDDFTIFHYKGNVTPPKDEEVWKWFIKSFVEHLILRYGRDEVRQWFFEVWNEPNLGGDEGIIGSRFFSGTMQDYYELYKCTAKVIKDADPFFKVGGPATSNNAYIPEFIEYCSKNDAPLDFISTHHYPTDVVLGYGVEDSKNFAKKFNDTDKSDKDAMTGLISEYVTFQKDIWRKVDRGVLTDMTKRAVQESQGLPLYYTEWSSLSGLMSDGPFGASFIAKTVMDNMGLVKGYAYWTFSDVFEEGGMPSAAFHGGYGLMTLQGIPKAPYRAYEILHKLSDDMYEYKFSQNNVDIYAFKNRNANTVQLLVSNHQSLLHDIDDETVAIKFTGDILSEFGADVIRVDGDNANALKAWENMGSPEYIDNSQKYALLSASELKIQKIDIVGNCLTIEIPAQGLALITVYCK